MYGEKKNEELNPKNLVRTVKHGAGSVFAWGCMSASRQNNLVFIDGILNHSLYLNTLWDNLKLSAQNLGIRNNFIFYDNDPKNMAVNICL